MRKIVSSRHRLAALEVHRPERAEVADLAVARDGRPGSRRSCPARCTGCSKCSRDALEPIRRRVRRRQDWPSRVISLVARSSVLPSRGYRPDRGPHRSIATTGSGARVRRRAGATTTCWCRILDNARFAPSGGNRQGWRVIVLQRPDNQASPARALPRQLVRVPRPERRRADAVGRRSRTAPRNKRRSSMPAEIRAAAEAGPGGIAEHFDEAPVLLVVLADLRYLADGRPRPRPLHARRGRVDLSVRVEHPARRARRGTRRRRHDDGHPSEPEVKALLDVPDELAIAAVVALGHPVDPAHRPRRLRREPVVAFTSIDRYGGAPLP